ncbi:hypothetical protein C8F01DRAFT_320037 [Mycena amicta]|nr:hypothetical protein C8F01DRAFT_320037 [Mycena amicta]
MPPRPHPQTPVPTSSSSRLPSSSSRLTPSLPSTRAALRSSAVLMAAHCVYAHERRPSFLMRVHFALMSLGAWEGRAVAFVLGPSLYLSFPFCFSLSLQASVFSCACSGCSPFSRPPLRRFFLLDRRLLLRRTRGRGRG